MSFWDKVSKDFSKGVSDGLEVLKLKTAELTEEGKRRYNLFDLKSKAHKGMTELGGIVYDLSKTTKTPMNDPKVKAAISKVKKLEDQISKLERKTKTKKKTAKKVAKKKITRAETTAKGK